MKAFVWQLTFLTFELFAQTFFIHLTLSKACVTKSHATVLCGMFIVCHTQQKKEAGPCMPALNFQIRFRNYMN